MLGIAIQNEFLDLVPGTKLEMEQSNPFLQFDNQLTGDYSMPVELRLTPTNMRLLKFAGLIQTKVDNSGIDSAIFDDQNQVSVGKLKIESPKHNLNSANRASISLFYLTGSAGFFQDIKDIKMRQANIGGVRSFAWDNYAMTGGGFWSHINQVLNSPVNLGLYDYGFFPVCNKQWTGESWTSVSSELMNYISYVDNNVDDPFFLKTSTDRKELNPIVPFPYLHYVMKKVVEHVGWKIDGAIFNDVDFRKIVMVNFQSIDWGYMTKSEQHKWITGTTTTPGIHPATIQFDLADHMPDITISDFLLALKNRFGWWYEFDNKNKTINIKELQNVIAASTKDFTKYASPVIPKKVDPKAKIYSLKNEFIGEYANGQPSLTNVYYQGSLNHKSQLPAPTPALYGYTYLIREENNFYICKPVDDGTNNDVFTWQLYAYNVFDVVPANATDEIITKATTIGVEHSSFMLNGVDTVDPYNLYPRIDMPGNWGALTDMDATWGIHLLFNHGIRPNTIGRKFPYASSHPYDVNGNQLTNWSLTFQCELFDGTLVGLYDRNWKKVLDSLINPETFEFTLYLPLAEYNQLQFNDTIIIDGVKMYLTKIKPSIPYSGELQVESLRIY